MDPTLHIRRRLLAKAYRRYLDADLRWMRVSEEVRLWFPDPGPRARRVIGDPGSPTRRAWETREAAIRQLQAAREKLRIAEVRLAVRRSRVIYLLDRPAR